MKQTVLVTGATGFLGSHLVKGLLKDGHQVIILKRSFSNTWRINKILPQLIAYDIDKDSIEQPFKDFQRINTIIHTATVYGRKQETISDILEVNTVFPLKLLQLGIEFNIDSFFNTDTSLSKELNFYTLSKKQFLESGQKIAERDKIKFINIQIEQMLGPDDDESKFPIFVIKQCLKNVPKLDMTLGEQKRDFIYIDDVVSAYLLLLHKANCQTDFFQDYELGSGKAVSLKEYVETVKELTQSQTKFKFGAVPYRDNEIMHSEANIHRLTELGWKCKFQLRESIIKIIEFERIRPIDFSRKDDETLAIEPSQS